MHCFSIDTYTSRRARLRSQVDSGIILLLGNEESGMSYADNVYPFRQDSSFLYFFAIDSPGLAGIIDIDEDKEIIFGNELSIDDIVWMGQQETLKDKASSIGVNQVENASSIQSYLEKARKQGRTIHFLPPYRPENKIKLNQWLDIPIQKLAEEASEKLIRSVVAQREIKSDEEVEQIEYAVQLTNEMHLTAMRMARPGITEAEICAAVDQVPRAVGSIKAFPTILTVRGEILHNHHYDNILQDGQLCLSDAGAESPLHYAGDMSRTSPVSGTFTPMQKTIYDICLNAHENAIEMIKPGIQFLDVHYKACTGIAEGLKSLGLMKGDIHEAVQQGAHALFFQCGTGHQMGLDVHDMEDLGEQFVGYTDAQKKNTELFGVKSLRLGKELQEGFVVTVEPGIYFIPELIDMWKAENKFSSFINYEEVEKFRNFGGLRNEDDILVTNDKYRILGNFVPKTTEDIEQLKAESMSFI